MREINWAKPLSKDDRTWLEQRLTPDVVEKIEANDRQFSGDTKAVESEVEFTDNYDKWKVEELKSEAEGREPPVDLTGITKKSELIAALRTWDAAYPDAEEA